MPFRVPTFNLLVNVFRAPWVVPPIGPPAITPLGNLTPGRRSQDPMEIYPGGTATWYWMFLLLPPLTDVRDKLNTGGGDLVEVPAGSGRYYQVMAVDDVAKGFPNEYRWAALIKVGTPTPMP